jgi:hypothetical protein
MLFMQVIETRDLISATRFHYLHPNRPSLIICIKYIQLPPLSQSPTHIPSDAVHAYYVYECMCVY